MIVIKKAFTVFIYLTIFILLIFPLSVYAIDADTFQDTFLEQLEYHPAELLGVEGHGMDAPTVDREIARVYHENGLQPFWVTENGPSERAKILFEVLSVADEHGLNPQDYQIDKIRLYWDRRDAVSLTRLDILI